MANFTRVNVAEWAAAQNKVALTDTRIRKLAPADAAVRTFEAALHEIVR